MKQKVAIIATCLNLILCVAFLLICACYSRDAMNSASLQEIARICRLSAIELDSAAFTADEGKDYLRQLSSAANVSIGVYQKDGQSVYTGAIGSRDALEPDELRVTSGNVSVFRRDHAFNRQPWLYAVTRLKTDDVLCVSRAAYGLMDAMHNRLPMMIVLAFAVACIGFAILQVSIVRTDSFLESVLSVLSDFSEGKFDSRISAKGDSIGQTARFNEIMGRIQDRVFRQKTRNQALSTVMNHMQNGILAVDDQLNVILVTPAAKQLLGIVGSPEGHPIQQVSRDVKLDEVLRAAMNQEGVYTNEVAARTQAGRGHRPIRLYVSPMMKEDQAVGAVALVEDVTELRRLEQVRTDFAANVSHELKTPLTSIKGFVETLQNGAIRNPEMADKFLRIIMLEADRLTRLINDILSITKMESGKDEVPPERVRLDKIAHDICDMLSILASEKGVTIHSRLNDQPSYVMGNPDHVEQMMINLVENAIKYNKQGGSVTVSVFNSDNTVNLLVGDTGIGISEEHLPRMFERFYRVDKGRSRSMGGTGLGLAIVKHIVRKMDGMIEVRSKLGEGTEFLISLPRIIVTDEEEQSTFAEDEFDKE